MFDPVWKCRDGTTVRIGDMADSHLQNSIAKIRRDGSWRREFLPRLELEVELRAMGFNTGAIR